jgi:hypothetical protein
MEGATARSARPPRREKEGNRSETVALGSVPGGTLPGFLRSVHSACDAAGRSVEALVQAKPKVMMAAASIEGGGDPAALLSVRRLEAVNTVLWSVVTSAAGALAAARTALTASGAEIHAAQAVAETLESRLDGGASSDSKEADTPLGEMATALAHSLERAGVAEAEAAAARAEANASVRYAEALTEALAQHDVGVPLIIPEPRASTTRSGSSSTSDLSSPFGVAGVEVANLSRAMQSEARRWERSLQAREREVAETREQLKQAASSMRELRASHAAELAALRTALDEASTKHGGGYSSRQVATLRGELARADGELRVTREAHTACKTECAELSRKLGAAERELERANQKHAWFLQSLQVSFGDAPSDDVVADERLPAASRLAVQQLLSVMKRQPTVAAKRALGMLERLLETRASEQETVVEVGSVQASASALGLVAEAFGESFRARHERHEVARQLHQCRLELESAQRSREAVARALEQSQDLLRVARERSEGQQRGHEEEVTRLKEEVETAKIEVQRRTKEAEALRSEVLGLQARFRPEGFLPASAAYELVAKLRDAQLELGVSKADLARSQQRAVGAERRAGEAASALAIARAELASANARAAALVTVKPSAHADAHIAPPVSQLPVDGETLLSVLRGCVRAVLARSKSFPAPAVEFSAAVEGWVEQGCKGRPPSPPSSLGKGPSDSLLRFAAEAVTSRLEILALRNALARVPTPCTSTAGGIDLPEDWQSAVGAEVQGLRAANQSLALDVESLTRALEAQSSAAAATAATAAAKARAAERRSNADAVREEREWLVSIVKSHSLVRSVDPLRTLEGHAHSLPEWSPPREGQASSPVSVSSAPCSICDGLAGQVAGMREAMAKLRADNAELQAKLESSETAIASAVVRRVQALERGHLHTREDALWRITQGLVGAERAVAKRAIEQASSPASFSRERDDAELEARAEAALSGAWQEAKEWVGSISAVPEQEPSLTIPVSAPPVVRRSLGVHLGPASGVAPASAPRTREATRWAILLGVRCAFLKRQLSASEEESGEAVRAAVATSERLAETVKVLAQALQEEASSESTSSSVLERESRLREVMDRVFSVARRMGDVVETLESGHLSEMQEVTARVDLVQSRLWQLVSARQGQVEDQGETGWSGLEAALGALESGEALAAREREREVCGLEREREALAAQLDVCYEQLRALEREATEREEAMGALQLEVTNARAGRRDAEEALERSRADQIARVRMSAAEAVAAAREATKRAQEALEAESVRATDAEAAGAEQAAEQERVAAALRRRLEQADARLKEGGQRMERAAAEVAGLRARLEEAEAEAEAAKVVARETAKRDAVERERIQSRLEAVEAECARAERAKTELEGELSEARAKSEHLEQAVSEWEAQAEEHRQRAVEAQAESEARAEQLEAVRAELQSSRETVATLEGKLRVVVSSRKEQRAEADTARAELQEAKRVLSEAQKSVAKLRKSVVAADARAHRAEAAAAAMRGSAASQQREAEQALDACKRECARHESKVLTLESRLSAAHDEMRELRERLARTATRGRRSMREAPSAPMMVPAVGEEESTMATAFEQEDTAIAPTMEEEEEEQQQQVTHRSHSATAPRRTRVHSSRRALTQPRLRADPPPRVIRERVVVVRPPRAVRPPPADRDKMEQLEQQLGAAKARSRKSTSAMRELVAGHRSLRHAVMEAEERAAEAEERAAGAERELKRLRASKRFRQEAKPPAEHQETHERERAALVAVAKMRKLEQTSSRKIEQLRARLASEKEENRAIARDGAEQLSRLVDAVVRLAQRVHEDAHSSIMEAGADPACADGQSIIETYSSRAEQLRGAARAAQEEGDGAALRAVALAAVMDLVRGTRAVERAGRVLVVEEEEGEAGPQAV